MLRILNKKKPWPIGVDCTADAIRLLQLQQVGGQWTVLSGGLWSRNDGAQGAGEFLGLEAAREILGVGGFEGQNAVSCVSSRHIQVHNVRLPQINGEDLNDALMSKAEAVLDDVLHYKLYAFRAGPVVRGEIHSVEWGLLAMPHYEIRKRVDTLETVGLHVRAIEPEPLSLFRTFRRMLRRDADRMVVNTFVVVGQESTVVIMSRGASLFFVKIIQRGEQRLTAANAEHMGISYHEAELLRRQLKAEYAELVGSAMGAVHPAQINNRRGDALLWTVYDAVRSEADSLVLDIGLCLRYVSTTFGCPKIDRLILAGSGGSDPTLVYLLNEQLGVQCELARPMLNVDSSRCSIFTDRRGGMSDWATCVGLAGWADPALGDGRETLVLRPRHLAQGDHA
jgi:Tfp pilus assembly PilM family ATPase